MKGHYLVFINLILPCILQEFRCNDLYFVFIGVLGKGNSRQKSYKLLLGVVTCDLDVHLFFLCIPGIVLCILLKSTKATNAIHYFAWKMWLYDLWHCLIQEENMWSCQGFWSCHMIFTEEVMVCYQNHIKWPFNVPSGAVFFISLVWFLVKM